jgi:small conductance mechanosensitive channel
MQALIKTYLQSLGIDRAQEWAHLSNAMLRIALVLFIAWLLLRVSRRLVGVFRHYMSRKAVDQEQIRRADTLAHVFRYSTGVLITIVAGMLVLSELGISIAPVLATAGVAGLAIGFGAQALVKDYFTGFCILIEDQIRQGDVVQIAGLSGAVERVTLRFVQLRDYAGNVHFVPNGAITTVTNSSRGFAFAVIDVGIAYRQDSDQAIEVMRRLGRELREDPVLGPRILEDLEMAGIDQLAESAVMSRCRLRTLPLEQWTIKREFLRRLKKTFDAEGIEIPFKTLTLYQGKNPDDSAAAFALSPSGAERGAEQSTREAASAQAGGEGGLS